MNFFVDDGSGALYGRDTLSGERFTLSLERIGQIGEEEAVHPSYIPFFRAAAEWILFLLSVRRSLEDGGFESATYEELSQTNRALYKDVLAENYENSWANPGYCIRMFGKKHGQILSAFVYELRSMIPLVYEGDAGRFLIRMELFLEIYFAFVVAFNEEIEEQRARGGKGSEAPDPGLCGEDGAGKTGKKAVSGIPAAKDLREKIRRYLEDYAEEETLVRVRRCLVGGSLPERILGVGEPGSRGTDAAYYSPGDHRCLFRYGAYVSENETEIFSYLESLTEDEIAKMADTWTEGFRIGFEVTGKDLSIRRRAGLFYSVGFERVARRAADNLKKMGLCPVVPGQQTGLFVQHLGRGGGGIESTSPNPQYDYDHQEDLALFYSDILQSKRISALKNAYRELEEETVLYAGPLVLETFGEKPFSPVMNRDYPRFSSSLQKKIAKFRQEADLLYDKAVIGRERSFTIIAFPVPEITKGYEAGAPQASFEEIFRAVVRINTLDYMTWRRVQARIIEVLDTACSIRVLGRGENRTDLTVCLQKLQDHTKQTIFENCVADVNIPVGEVFTTPALSGTNGVLHVTKVYLEGLLFEDLFMRFENGRVSDYGCGGFPTPEEGKKYIEENILFHHETLPMSECAIGTNTTAAAMAARLGILERLPILIAEKTGPHFAVGDTCYSHEEENRVFNPDGKEIIAKDNEYSLLRDTEPDKAYFGCHTDITIPYEEVGLLAAVLEDGREIPVIRGGLFVLPGTQSLNEPFLSK